MPQKDALTPYKGRFAPSPSGPLHLGSLVCALASYFHAKQHQGKWLVRMEDIDPPREELGAKTVILESLQQHGLFWDQDVLYQSQRSDAYLSSLQWLESRELTYPCSCTRKRLISLNGRYDAHCQAHPPNEQSPCGIRLKSTQSATTIPSATRFVDKIRGPQTEDLQQTCGDFLVHRKDGLFAYQLAVVVDDIAQGITDIVRGDDLLESTTRQIHLTKVLGGKPASYAHIPVVLGDDGNKLSKQAHAPAIDNTKAQSNLISALHLLHVPTPPPAINKSLDALLVYGCENFQLSRLIPSNT